VSTTKPYILVTNDDGITSAGLKAAVEVAATIGDVVVVAPSQQCSNTGRAMPMGIEWKYEQVEMQVFDKPIRAFASEVYPAQNIHLAIDYGLVERFPSLVISGINYGLNVGNGVSISGTVGAAMEASATYGIPALAISVETRNRPINSQPASIDFESAKYFTKLFANRWLALQTSSPSNNIKDIQVLKIEIPEDATPETPWEITRVSKHRYWHPNAQKRTQWSARGQIEWHTEMLPEALEDDSDIAAVLVRRRVAVTPLSSDLTAKITF